MCAIGTHCTRFRPPLSFTHPASRREYFSGFQTRDSQLYRSGPMLPSILATFLFAASGVFGRRSAMMMGALPANFARLFIATAVLGAMTWMLFPGTLQSGPVFNWFFFSGVIGFGMGDLALFLAFQRIGSRLTVLLTQCLAAPIAALAEYLWMGTTISLAEAGSAVLIFAGVALAIAPGARRLPTARAPGRRGSSSGSSRRRGRGWGPPSAGRPNSSRRSPTNPPTASAPRSRESSEASSSPDSRSS